MNSVVAVVLSFAETIFSAFLLCLPAIFVGTELTTNGSVALEVGASASGVGLVVLPNPFVPLCDEGSFVARVIMGVAAYSKIICAKWLC